MIVPSRVAAWGAALLIAGLLSAGCRGDGAPTTPSPSPGPAPTPNTVPVVESVTASTERAEVGEEVTITAAVRDAETPVAQLRHEWSAPAGTFVAGPPGTAVWRAPSDRPTPEDYRATLTVVETYGPGNTQEHRVSAMSPAIRVHNSPAELSALATGFLRDFSTSSVPPASAVRDFSDRCPGKGDELGDVQRNRDNYVINAYTLGTPNVAVRYGGGCNSLPHPRPRDSPPADACITVSVEWHSTERASGRAEVARGTSVLSGVYHDRRWWLCDSQFASPSTVSPRFIR